MTFYLFSVDAWSSEELRLCLTVFLRCFVNRIEEQPSEFYSGILGSVWVWEDLHGIPDRFVHGHKESKPSHDDHQRKVQNRYYAREY